MKTKKSLFRTLQNIIEIIKLIPQAKELQLKNEKLTNLLEVSTTEKSAWQRKAEFLANRLKTLSDAYTLNCENDLNFYSFKNVPTEKDSFLNFLKEKALSAESYGTEFRTLCKDDDDILDNSAID